jgi:thiol-disulfide isomerase/thioredoxin
MVEFYAPWCVHCQKMVSAYKKTAILLEGTATLGNGCVGGCLLFYYLCSLFHCAFEGAVNCEEEKNLCKQQQVTNNVVLYPSIYFLMTFECLFRLMVILL